MKYLVEKAIKQDKEAFVELMELNKQNMYKTARGFFSREEDIADVIQDTILSCYENLSSLKEPKYFTTWLTRILINHCNELYQRKQKEYFPDTFPDMVDEYSREQNFEFEELMNTLDDKYRVILLLYYTEGFNTREIAQILEIPENTVKTRLVRGRREFERVYKECLREV